jgi:hypothetical protein
VSSCCCRRRRHYTALLLLPWLPPLVLPLQLLCPAVAATIAVATAVSGASEPDTLTVCGIMVCACVCTG